MTGLPIISVTTPLPSWSAIIRCLLCGADIRIPEDVDHELYCRRNVR